MSGATTGTFVLLMPGQGAQRRRMAAGLYGREAAFTAAMDEVFAAWGPDGNRLRADWLSDEPAVPVDHVTRSTPLLFAVDYALAAALRDRGVAPAAILGHSIGEMAAAVVAGIFDLTEIAPLLLERVRRMEATPPGGMLAVAAALPELRDCLGWETAALSGGGVAVAAVNAPRQIVLAGLTGPLRSAARRLEAAGLTTRVIPATRAFHGPAMAPLAQADRELFSAVSIHPPRVPVYSSYAGGLLGPPALADPAFWASHPAAPVFFWTALDRLLADHAGRPLTLVEAGPGQELCTLARRHPGARGSRIVPLLPGPGDDTAAFEAVVARLLAP